MVWLGTWGNTSGNILEGMLIERIGRESGRICMIENDNLFLR